MRERTKERTNVSLPKGLAARAHKLGINVSAVVTIAVENAVKKLEEEKHE